MQSNSNTVNEYIAELPEERRKAVQEVRKTILENLPEGYEEVLNWGMITYQIPLETYPNTYNKKPLMYVGLASQKKYMSLYMTGIYLSEASKEEFEAAYRATGKRYDVGKSCVRFRKIDDLPLSLIGKSVSSYSVNGFIERYEEARSTSIGRRKKQN